MADVKLKNGYFKIAHKLFEQLFIREFSLKQIRVILLVMRLSYGFHKKYAIIKPKSRFNFANLHNPDINKILNELISKKVLLKVAEDAYSINKDYDVWDIPYHKFYNEKKFIDLQALQFISETLTPEVSETLTDDVSETLTEGLVNHSQETAKSERNANNDISETLTKNEDLLVNHLPEQPENADSESDINSPKYISKDNIKHIIKDTLKGNEEENNEKNTPKIDPYFNNPVADKFKAEYKKIFKKSDCYLDNFKLNKLLEINSDNPEFLNLLPEILTKYSKLNFTNGKPSLKWLIIEGGWAGILNGEYDQYISEDKKDSNSGETWSLDEIAKNDNYDEDMETLRKMGLV